MRIIEIDTDHLNDLVNDAIFGNADAIRFFDKYGEFLSITD